MNRTSRSSRLVSSAARSPAFAITGPDVARKFTPSSRATICASVVLPSPGGPNSSTWSSASFRDLAASMKTLRFPFACCCPTNSLSVCGRSALSAGSNGAGSPETSRSGRSLTTHTPSPPQLLQGGLDQGRDLDLLAEAGGGGFDDAAGGGFGDAQAQEGGHGLAGGAGLHGLGA